LKKSPLPKEVQKPLLVDEIPKIPVPKANEVHQKQEAIKSEENLPNVHLLEAIEKMNTSEVEKGLDSALGKIEKLEKRLSSSSFTRTGISRQNSLLSKNKWNKWKKFKHLITAAHYMKKLCSLKEIIKESAQILTLGKRAKSDTELLLAQTSNDIKEDMRPPKMEVHSEDELMNGRVGKNSKLSEHLYGQAIGNWGTSTKVIERKREKILKNEGFLDAPIVKQRTEDDVEIDLGKVKKVKKKKEIFQNGNVFQKLHEEKLKRPKL